MILRRLARIKSRMTRFNWYINVLQLALLVSIRGVAWWYLLVPIGFLVVYWFESTYGIKGEMDVSWSQSEEWRKFLVRLDVLEKKIDKL